MMSTLDLRGRPWDRRALRDALPRDGVAVVTVFALMGGFEILIPETWSVTSEVTPFMGSVEDHART